MKRARTSLPKSPHKQRCVVRKLAESVGLNVSTDSSPSTQYHGSALSTDTKKCVVDFYNNSDISWQAPGRKDRVIIRETVEREKMKTTEQVRYMLMSLREAYKFKEEYPSLKVGLTKFCEWRPAHVKLFDQIPHQVCVCSYHENVRLLLVALKEHTTLNTDFAAFTEQVTCDPSAKVCMSGKCSKCANAIDKYAPVNNSNPVHYQQWQSVDKRVEKVDKMGTVGGCFEELKTQVGPFLLHTYVKRKQAASFKSLVEGCDGKSVVLQVDFSENATIASQREIQSAHWNHGQATLFTAHAWIKAGSEDTAAESQSMVIVSDDLNHTKYSIYVFMQRVFCYLKATFPNIEHVNVFSDGPTSQFKQRFLFSNLCAWEMEHDLKITWNFFATSHGKGVVDGIGGTLKRAVWRHVKAERAHVTNASEYSTLGKRLCPNINIEFISKEDISELTSFLDTKWSTTKPVPGTYQVHCVKSHGSDSVQVSDITDGGEARVCVIRTTTTQEEQSELDEQEDKDKEEEDEQEEEEETEIQVGQWVVVLYDGIEYPGEVRSIDSNTGVQVNVMHKSGSCWKWPQSRDMIYYKKSNILRVISVPVVAGHRGQFTFSDF